MKTGNEMKNQSEGEVERVKDVEEAFHVVVSGYVLSFGRCEAYRRRWGGGSPGLVEH
jgi:hypothetical protein